MTVIHLSCIFVIVKSLWMALTSLSVSLPVSPPLSLLLLNTHIYTLTHAQTVGQWDYEGEGGIICLNLP